MAHARCRCGREWDALGAAHCTVCHEHFSTVGNFDRHRRTGHCQHPASLTDRHGQPVLKPVAGRYGVTWVGAAERPQLETDDVA